MNAETKLADAGSKGKAGGKVTRADLEDKFRQLQGDLSSAVEGAKSKAVVGGGLLVLLVLIAVFVAGRRAGKKQSTVVEIRRL